MRRHNQKEQKKKLLRKMCNNFKFDEKNIIKQKTKHNAEINLIIYNKGTKIKNHIIKNRLNNNSFLQISI